MFLRSISPEWEAGRLTRESLLGVKGRVSSASILQFPRSRIRLQVEFLTLSHNAFAQAGFYSGMLTLIVQPFLLGRESICLEDDSLILVFVVLLSAAVLAEDKCSHFFRISSCVYSGFLFSSLLNSSICFSLPFVSLLEIYLLSLLSFLFTFIGLFLFCVFC